MIGLGVGIGKLTPPHTGTPIPPGPPQNFITEASDNFMIEDGNQLTIE